MHMRPTNPLTRARSQHRNQTRFPRMNYSTFDTMKVSADRSAPVQWRLRSKSPEIGAVIDHLVGQIRLIKGYKKPPPVKGLRAAAELLVLNFLRCRYSDHNRLLGIPLNSGAGLYKCGRVSYTNMMLAVRGMTTLQLLTVAYGGYRDREAGRGRQTRFQGAPELFALCAAFGATPNMVLSRERDPLVELRGEKPKDGSRAKVYERWPSTSSWPEKPAARDRADVTTTFHPTSIWLTGPCTGYSTMAQLN